MHDNEDRIEMFWENIIINESEFEMNESGFSIVDCHKTGSLNRHTKHNPTIDAFN